MQKNIKFYIISFLFISLSIKASTKDNDHLVGKVIDMHTHTAGIGSGGSGCFVSESMLESYKFKFYLKAFNTSLDEIEKKGDGHVIKLLSDMVSDSKYVKKAVIYAMDGIINSYGELDKERTTFFVPNDFVAKESSKHSNLYWGASINPNRNDAIHRLNKAYLMKAVLVKWLPSIQLFNPSDEKYIPFYQKLIELNLPLVIHVGEEDAFDEAYDEFGNPHLLKLPLSLGVKVIAAHVGTKGKYGEEESHRIVLNLMNKYPNLYSDISSLTLFNKLSFVKDIVSNKDFHNRFLNGSDYPLINSILVSPGAAYYYYKLLQKEDYLKIKMIDNPFDRDIAMKKAFGFGNEIFLNSAIILGLEN